MKSVKRALVRKGGGAVKPREVKSFLHFYRSGVGGVVGTQDEFSPQAYPVHSPQSLFFALEIPHTIMQLRSLNTSRMVLEDHLSEGRKCIGQDKGEDHKMGSSSANLQCAWLWEVFGQVEVEK